MCGMVVAKPSETTEYAFQFLRIGGRMVLLKDIHSLAKINMGTRGTSLLMKLEVFGKDCMC